MLFRVAAVCICYFITAFTQGGIGSIQTNQLLFGPLEYTQQFILIPGIACPISTCIDWAELTLLQALGWD
jgi:hypothetical protein